MTPSEKKSRKPGPQPARAKKSVLRERAKKLAAPPVEQIQDTELVEIVEFLLADERYGIESSHVSEVHPLREVAEIPCTPRFVLGTVNIRGRIVSVIDLRALFAMEQPQLPVDARVVVLKQGEMEFSVAAESVLGVRSIPAAEIRPPLATMTGIKREYTAGVTGDGLTLLDASKMLSDPALIVDEVVTPQT